LSATSRIFAACSTGITRCFDPLEARVLHPFEFIFRGPRNQCFVRPGLERE
jgi:hypothetical protein